MFFKNNCTRYKSYEKITKCSDRFIEIFGGPRALANHKKSNLNMSASPVSRNAVAPTLEPNQFGSKERLPEEMEEQDLFNQGLISQVEKEKTMTALELQQILSPDLI